MIRFWLCIILISVIASSCKTADAVRKYNKEATTIYLVRHTEKADDGTKDPPLTEEGNKRAEKLAAILKSKKITHIFSSDYKRTQETAFPLSRNTKIAIRSYDPRNLQTISEQLLQLKGSNILVVGHSNSTPSLANVLVNKEEFSQFDESEYSNMITIIVTETERVSQLTQY